MHVNPAQPDHPVFAGVDRARLRLWSDYLSWNQTRPGFPRVYPVEHGFRLTKPEDLKHASILADYDAGLQGVALCEIFDGQGSVMLSAFDLVKRRGLDPVADRMLRNLLTYMAGAEPHRPHPLITEPLRWGNFPTQRGVISGPINGFFYNTVFVPPPTDPGATPPDKSSGWNTRPGDQWKPRGIRPRGPFIYTFNCSPRDADKSDAGTGLFFVTLPPGKTAVLTRATNPTDSPLTLQIEINDAKSAIVEIAPGKILNIKAPITADATRVGVRYTGSRELVILETDFQ